MSESYGPPWPITWVALPVIFLLSRDNCSKMVVLEYGTITLQKHHIFVPC
jgi:hypothetical protein